MNFLIKVLGWNPADYNEWEIHWGPDHPEWLILFIAILVPLALWFFWTSLNRIRSRGKKAFLFSLRVMTFILFGFLLLRPELEFKKSHSMRNSIAVLLDDSKSMSIQTFPDETPRIDLVRKTLENNRDYLKSLEKDFNVEYFFVSDKAVPVPRAEVYSGYRPKAANTDFTRMLREIKKHYEDKSLQGILLFTDGADLVQEPGEISDDLRKVLSGIKGPVHSFQAGTNESFKDLAIERVEAPDFGFIHQPVQLSVTIYASNMGNKNVPLVLKEGNKILVSKVVELREGKNRYKVDMQFTAQQIGKRIYSLSVPLFAGESIETNNRRVFRVTVIRDRLRILHLNGRPSWDSRFLREVLVNNPKVDLLSFFILRTLGDDVVAPTSELSLIPFPSNLLFSDYLNSFDLILFQNFRFESFIDKKLLSNMKAYVKKGGAFLMVGGELSFQGGGYARTPVEDILPVSMRRGSRIFLQDEFRPALNPKFLRHPVLRLEKDEKKNLEIWRKLPPLRGLNIGLVPKKNSYVLLSYRKKNGKTKSYPLLVLGKYGKGRTGVLATDSSWNWNFRMVGEGGSGRYYQKFWDNLIAWMTADPETHLLQLETDKEMYQEEEPVLIKFRVLGEDYQPSGKEKVKLVLSPMTGKSQIKNLETDQKGEGSFSFVPSMQGFYKARVQIDRKENPLFREIIFGVFSDTAEFDKPLVNPQLLKKISGITGGTYEILTKNTRLEGIRFENPRVIVKTKSKTLSLWDNWMSFGLILGFLVFDWWLRRKSGLS